MKTKPRAKFNFFLCFLWESNSARLFPSQISASRYETIVKIHQKTIAKELILHNILLDYGVGVRFRWLLWNNSVLTTSYHTKTKVCASRQANQEVLTN